MEKDVGKVEWLAVLPDEANDDPTSRSCLHFLPGCHFQNPMAGGEQDGRWLGFVISDGGDNGGKWTETGKWKSMVSP